MYQPSLRLLRGERQSSQAHCLDNQVWKRKIVDTNISILNEDLPCFMLVIEYSPKNSSTAQTRALCSNDMNSTSCASCSTVGRYSTLGNWITSSFIHYSNMAMLLRTAWEQWKRRNIPNFIPAIVVRSFIRTRAWSPRIHFNYRD